MGYVIDIVDWYREVLRDDPDSEVFVLLAEALRFDGRWAEAVRACREGLTRHPRNLRARVILGVCLSRLGETEESRKVLDSARQELEKNADMYETLSGLAMEDGESERSQRFSDICRNMRIEAATGSVQHLPYKPESAKQPEEGAEAGVVEKEGPVQVRRAAQHEELLCSWLQRCEQKKESPPVDAGLFSDSERDLLRQLLSRPEQL